jgi:5'-3' exonuclease, N-terminal resolvase-like domain/T4 RNase H, C terminal
LIIVDLNQVAISNLMVQLSMNRGSYGSGRLDIHGDAPVSATRTPNEDMLRHMMLNTIRAIKNKFCKQYGEMVIACDARHSWRKNVFSYYKANRKKNRDASDLDWNQIFLILDKIKLEIKENFPYRVIDVLEAEADDIIGTLANTYGVSEPIIIISGDKDFIQLQKNPNVKQYDPVRDRYPSHDDPVAFLKEHIIRGDTGDGIPNYLSDDNCLVVGERQKAIRQAKLDVWLTQEPTEFCSDVTLRNYDRNKLLIDLNNTPSDIKDSIIREYQSQANKTKAKLFNYFVKNKLASLLENIQDF